MTSKLKCPFCGEELTEYPVWGFGCGNTNCNKTDGVVGSEKLWQALIQSQKDLAESQQATLQNAQTVLEIHKDLEIAREALTDIFFICELDASKDANARISEIYAIAKNVLEHKE